MHSELQTIRDFLRYAASRFNEANLFFGHGTDNAWDEAVALALHILRLPPDVEKAVEDIQLNVSQKKQFIKLHKV